jgi:DNA primase
MRVVNDIGRWRCWACGRGGTAIDALVAARRLTVGEAIRHLAENAHFEPIRHPDDQPATPVSLHPAVVSYAEACARVLSTRAGAPVLSWLTDERGIAVDVIRANLVGADPGPDLLRRRRGLPRARRAAVLPSFDADGNVSYVQARYLDPDAPTKYGNPVTRLGSNPGLSWTRGQPSSAPLLVCEGVLDALTAATAGLASVAVLGATYPSQRMADQIARGAGSRPLVIAFDGDEPGRIAAERLQGMLADRGVDAGVCDLPDGADLNSLARQGPDRLTSLLAVPA